MNDSSPLSDAGQDRSALVLFSGGQDSTVCLAWALDRFDRVETIGFDYRQRHSIELDCRQVVLSRLRAAFAEWGAKLGEDHTLDLGVLGQVSDTALTRDQEILTSGAGLPSTFVPARNLVFLSLASAVAYRRGASTLIGGMCETDFSGYPDCRRETIDAMQAALTLGLASPLSIETPLMHVDKAQTWSMAQDLGGETLIDIIVQDTHTCYLGDRSLQHDWGYGCGGCPACELRAAGWRRFREGVAAP